MSINELNKKQSKPKQSKRGNQYLSSLISNQNILNVSQKSFGSNRSRVISKQPRIDIFYETKNQLQSQSHKVNQQQPQNQIHKNFKKDQNLIPQMHITYAQRNNEQFQKQKNIQNVEKNNESQQEISHFIGKFMDNINDLGYDTKNLNYSFCVSQKAESQGGKSEQQSQVLEQINFSQDFQKSQNQPNNNKNQSSNNKSNQNPNGVGLMSNNNSPFQQTYLSSGSRSKNQNFVDKNICAPQLSQSSQTIVVARNINNNNHHQLSYHLDQRGQDYISTPSFPLEDFHGQKLNNQALLNNRIKRFNSLNTDNIFLERIQKIRDNQNFFNEAQSNFVKKHQFSSQKQQTEKILNNLSASNNNRSNNNTVVQETSHLETSFNDNDEFSIDEGSKAKKIFLQDKFHHYNWFSENVPLLEIKETPSHIYTLRSLKQKVSQLESNLSQIKNIRRYIKEYQIPKRKQQFQTYLKLLSEQLSKRLQLLSNQKDSQQSKISQLQRHLSSLQIQNSQLKDLNSQLQSSLRMINEQQFESLNSHRSNNKSQKRSSTELYQEIKFSKVENNQKKKEVDARQSSVIKPYQEQNQNQLPSESNDQMLKIQSKQAKRILKQSISYQSKVLQNKKSQQLLFFQSAFPSDNLNRDSIFNNKRLQDQKLEQNFQEQLFEQNRFLNQQLQDQQKRNKQLLSLIEQQENQLKQNKQKMNIFQQNQQKIKELNQENQKLSQYVFDLQQRIVQFQTQITNLSEELKRFKSDQNQKFDEKIAQQLKLKSEQFFNRLQSVQEDHQKEILLLKQFFLTQIQSQRKKHLYQNTKITKNQNQIQILNTNQMQKKKNISKNNHIAIDIQQKRLKKQIKSLQLQFQTQKIFINQLKAQKLNLQSQLKDQKKRTKQLQIGSQHDFLAYSLKERQLQNQNKILKYRLLESIQKRQSLFSTSNTMNELQPFHNERFYQSFVLNSSRQIHKKYSPNLQNLQETVINNPKVKKVQCENNPQNNYSNRNLFSSRYNSQKINKILSNIKVKHKAQPNQINHLNNKNAQKSFILKQSTQKSKSKQSNKIVVNPKQKEYNPTTSHNIKSYYNDCKGFNSKKRLNLLNVENYNTKYYPMVKHSSKLNFEDVLSTIPVSPSSVNLQKSIKMNQISQKLQKLRHDIRKQLKY